MEDDFYSELWTRTEKGVVKNWHFVLRRVWLGYRLIPCQNIHCFARNQAEWTRLTKGGMLIENRICSPRMTGTTSQPTLFGKTFAWGQIISATVHSNVLWPQFRTGLRSTPISGPLAKLRKAIVSFVMCLSVCLSVRPHGRPRLPLDGFSWTLIADYFSKVCRENPSFIKIW